MNREEILEKLTDIFRATFKDPNLVLTNEMTPEDIDAWDSLSQVMLVSEMQEAFGIKFKLTELLQLTKVDNIINAIESKL